MKRVLKIRITEKIAKTEYLKKMNEQKLFYNSALFLTRFRYFEYIGKTEKLNYELRKNYNLENWFSNKEVWYEKQESYTDGFGKKIQEYLGTNLAEKEVQTILRKLSDDWTSYFKNKASAIESGDNRKVNLPGYKQYDYMTAEFNNQMILWRTFNKSHTIGLTKTESKIKLPDWLKRESVQAARLKYRNGYVYLEIIYNKEIKKKKERLLKSRVASIDPGLNNIATITFSWMKKPITIDGRYLKSVNQWYNKRTSKLKGLLSRGREEEETRTSRQIRKITEKRNLIIEHELYVISNYIIKILLENRVSTLVFGHNNRQKTELKIGKANNQNFVSIPFNKLISILKDKCEELGITFILQEESYTSKASFLSSDFIPTYNKEEANDYKFSGYRVKRGIYKDKKLRIEINADCNGSWNIMRKSNIISLNKLIKELVNYNKKIESYGTNLHLEQIKKSKENLNKNKKVA